MMDSKDSIILELVQSEIERIVVAFKYSLTSCEVPSTRDNIGLFKDDSCEPIIAVNVSSHYGHWVKHGFKVGQVTIHLSQINLAENQLYNLIYMRHHNGASSVHGSRIELAMQNGVLVLHSISEDLNGYTCISEMPWIDMDSFESPKTNSEPSSSFVVVTEDDTPPNIVDGLLFIESPPEVVESRDEQWIESNNEPDIVGHVESEDTVSTIIEPHKEEPRNEIEIPLFVAPHQMSVSVNISDRGFSQREVQSLKSTNKDLIQKQRKLTAIVQNLQEQLQKAREDGEGIEKMKALEKQVKECNADKRRLQNDVDQLLLAQAEFVSELQNLKEEYQLLKKKQTQTTTERDTQFARSSTLLNELQDKEKGFEVLESENKVLQGKVRRLDNDRRQRKEAETKSSKEIPRPHITPRETKPAAIEHRPKDLPLAGGAKLKPQPTERVVDGLKPTRYQLPSRRPTSDARIDVQRKQPAPRPDQTYVKHRSSGDDVTRVTGSNGRSGVDVTRVSGSNGRSGVDTACPICDKVLHARESDRSKQLHIEHCLLLSNRN